MHPLIYAVIAPILCFANLLAAQTQLKPGQPVPANLMIAGVNNNFIRGDFKYDDPDFRNIIKLTGVTTLRYPGGTSGSLFDWQTNQFVADDVLLSYGPKSWHIRHMDMKKRIAQSPLNTFSADNFAAMCKALNIEPVWIPNPVTVSPESNVQFFEHLKANNITCNFVEMGNECSGGAFWKPFPRGSDYANAIRPVMQRIRQLYPDAKIAVVANGHNVMQMKKAQEESGSADVRGETWNELIMADRQYFDAIILHSYGISPDRLREYSPDQWASLTLAYPGAYMNAVADMSRKLYDATPVWLTEYNAAFHHLMEGRPRKNDAAEAYFARVSDSSMQGLMIASYMIGAINDPTMWPVLNYHSLAGPDGFHLVKRMDGQWCVGPKTQIFHNLAQLIRDAKTMAGMQIVNGPKLDFTILNEQPLDAIAGAVLDNDTQRHWVLINRSAQPQVISLPWEVANAANIQIFPGELAPENPQALWHPVNSLKANQTLWPGVINIQQSTLQRSDKTKLLTQTLPPLSMTIVSLPHATH
jgi:hypothetical protein